MITKSTQSFRSKNPALGGHRVIKYCHQSLRCKQVAIHSKSNFRMLSPPSPLLHRPTMTASPAKRCNRWSSSRRKGAIWCTTQSKLSNSRDSRESNRVKLDKQSIKNSFPSSHKRTARQLRRRDLEKLITLRWKMRQKGRWIIDRSYSQEKRLFCYKNNYFSSHRVKGNLNHHRRSSERKSPKNRRLW